MPAPTPTAVPPLEVGPARHHQHAIFHVVIDALHGSAGAFIIRGRIEPFAGFEVCHERLNLLLHPGFQAGGAQAALGFFQRGDSRELMAPTRPGAVRLALESRITVGAGLRHNSDFMLQSYLLFAKLPGALAVRRSFITDLSACVAR